MCVRVSVHVCVCVCTCVCMCAVLTPWHPYIETSTLAVKSNASL